MSRTKGKGFEKRRLALQETLDAAKTQAERNRKGQFATSPALAADLLRYAAAQLDESNRVRFIDPAIGTGSFYSALLDVFPKKRIRCATGYEIDPHYGVPAAQLWGQTGLDMRLKVRESSGRPVCKHVPHRIDGNGCLRHQTE